MLWLAQAAEPSMPIDEGSEVVEFDGCGYSAQSNLATDS